MSKIVVAGSLNMDVVATAPRIPVTGETITGTRYFMAPGGKGANQAYAAAKLGGEVWMIGCVGKDAFGRELRQNLSDAGCYTTLVSDHDGPSGAAIICVAHDGQNSIIVIPGANAYLSPEAIHRAAPVLSECSILLLQLETPLETSLLAAQLTRKHGGRVILDPAPAPPAPLPGELLEAVEILTPNETEACILAGLAPARLTARDAENVAGQLRTGGARTVIVKLGEQGCLLVTEGGAELIPAARVDAIDTTAAGDVFNAALAVALTDNAELPEACRFAVNVAALSVTRLGTQAAAPTRAEADEFTRRLVP